MENRRRQDRPEIDKATIKISDLDQAGNIGHIENLSMEGLQLNSLEPIEIDIDFRLSLSLPVAVNDNTEILCSARSVWGKLADRLWASEKDLPDRYLTGFKLSDLSENDSKTIAELIERFGS